MNGKYLQSTYFDLTCELKYYDVRGKLLDWRDSVDTNRMPRGKQIELLSTLNKYKAEFCAKEKQ